MYDTQSSTLYGVSSGNANDCVPFIYGCLQQEYTNTITGNIEYNYNVNSGPYSYNSTNPSGTQGWSQSPVTRTGDNFFDVNSHTSFACVPCDTPSCSKPAGCVIDYDDQNDVTFDPASQDNFVINYQYGGGSSFGPFTMANAQAESYLVTLGGAGQYLPNIPGNVTFPFNYDEQWTDVYASGMNSVLDYNDWGLTQSMQAYGGNFSWDTSNHNACCNVSGCAHPYALNFDVVGWKRNPSDLSNPTYVGIGLENYDPALDTGRACRTCPDQPGGAVQEGRNLARYFKEENGVYSVNEDGYPGSFPDPLTYDNVYDVVNSSNTSKWKITKNEWKCCHFAYDTDTQGAWGDSGNGIVGCTNPSACTVTDESGSWNTYNWENYNPSAVFDNGSCCWASSTGNTMGSCSGCADTNQGGGGGGFTP
jgi:hypothetical protein